MGQQLGWHRRDKPRWARERQALRDRGWKHRVLYADGKVSIRVVMPFGTGDAEPASARLLIEFPKSYPWVPAEVMDYRGDLGVSRHRDPTRRGLLCLVHEDQFDPHQTAADLIAQQVPKLLLASRPEAVDGRTALAGLELPVADPITAYAGAQRQVLIPPGQIPSEVLGGVLVARLRMSNDGSPLTTLIESIIGPGVRLELDTPQQTELFPSVVYGQWMRDPDFDPSDTAAEVAHRIEPQLRSLEVGPRPESDMEFAPDEMTIVGLLVPSERTYRGTRESTFIFLLQVRAASRTGRRQYGYALFNSQVLDAEAQSQRTPISSSLRQKQVVLIGCGAIGHHIAIDLARAGVRRLDLVDRDFVDIQTQSRQIAPHTAAGHSKAQTLMNHVALGSLGTELEAWMINAVRLCEPESDPVRNNSRQALLTRISNADLVIDGAANPTLTAFLNAITFGRTPLLSVAGTAGLWGGSVALLRPRHTGCWECLMHYRIDRFGDDGQPWPVPPSDPDGWIAPVGCSELTFTGTGADAATLAHHASRVAIHHLAEGTSLGGDYYVAELRDAEGQPTPVTWRGVDLSVHRKCQNH